MDTRDVPQDGGVIDPMQHSIYAVDEDGKFVAVRSVGWGVTNLLSIQAMEEFRSKIELKMEEVKQGRWSPLAVYLVVSGLSPASLSQVSGVSWLKVRLHLRPWFFRRMSAADARRYAEVFGIDPSRLREFPELPQIPREDKKEDQRTA